MPIEINSVTRKRRLRNGPGRLAVAACSALLVACQHTVPPDPAPAVVEAPVPASAAAITQASERPSVPDTASVETTEEAVTGLLRYAERLRGMSAAERKQELSTLGSQISKLGLGSTAGAGTSPKNQMQLALVLLQTREPVETARALGLLQRVATSAEPEARAFAPLAHVLMDNLITTRRLEDNLERTSQQLRESQRRIDTLNERLDAMRAIERSMNAQPPSFARPARP